MTNAVSNSSNYLKLTSSETSNAKGVKQPPQSVDVFQALIHEPAPVVTPANLSNLIASSSADSYDFPSVSPASSGLDNPEYEFINGETTEVMTDDDLLFQLEKQKQKIVGSTVPVNSERLEQLSSLFQNEPEVLLKVLNILSPDIPTDEFSLSTVIPLDSLQPEYFYVYKMMTAADIVNKDYSHGKNIKRLQEVNRQLNSAIKGMISILDTHRFPPQQSILWFVAAKEPLLEQAMTQVFEWGHSKSYQNEYQQIEDDMAERKVRRDNLLKYLEFNANKDNTF